MHRLHREIPTPPDLRDFVPQRRYKPIPVWVPIALLLIWLAILFGWLAWLALG